MKRPRPVILSDPEKEATRDAVCCDNEAGYDEIQSGSITEWITGAAERCVCNRGNNNYLRAVVPVNDYERDSLYNI